MDEQVFVYSKGNVMLSQPQRRGIWGGVATHPQTLRFSQGDIEKFAYRDNYTP